MIRQPASWLLIGALLSSAWPTFAEEPRSEAPALTHTVPADGDDTEHLAIDQLQLFADVFHQIRAGYVEEVSDSALFEMAVEGMLAGLDPHSVYLTQDAYDDLQTSTDGAYSGLGLEIGREGDFVRIIAPIDGSPAEKAGLLAGDLILKIDGESVQGKTLDEASNLMRGPTGSAITLQIGRAGESQPLDISLIRDVIKVASVRSRELSDGYIWLRIAQFQRDTGRDVIDALKPYVSEGPIKGLVLDLRNNPGGVLSASVEVAGAVLDGGLVVYTQGRHPSSDEAFDAEPGDMLSGVPIVVLINGGSASASEIVAGALQDRSRAIIMGTRSFGKGSVQSVLPVSETRAVKLTTARYYTPNGRSIQAEGIVPDIVVERARITSVENARQIKEADLAGSLDATDQINNDAESDRLTELRNTDNQLYEALTLLRGVHLFQRQPVQEAPPEPEPPQ
jgi:carboxyl-terminal processing protease